MIFWWDLQLPHEASSAGVRRGLAQLEDLDLPAYLRRYVHCTQLHVRCVACCALPSAPACAQHSTQGTQLKLLAAGWDDEGVRHSIHQTKGQSLVKLEPGSMLVSISGCENISRIQNCTRGPMDARIFVLLCILKQLVQILMLPSSRSAVLKT